MNDLQQFAVNPIPATEGAGNPIKLAPGEPVPHPSTLTSNTIHSTVRHDPELNAARGLHQDDAQAFGVNPIPATGGIGNPIKLAPGEPVPHPSTLTSNTIHSTVRDGSQYGVSDTGAPVLPPVLDSQSEAEANGASMFGLPAVGGTMIPESSLPMGDSAKLPAFDNAFTSSAAPQSTTSQLAAQVPLQPRGVPEVVSDSQHSAHVGPEAASSVQAVQDKREVEEELKERMPEEPAAAESGPVTGVPGVVTDSQHAAHRSPEAAANPEAVREKAVVENELKQTVPEEQSNPSVVPGQQSSTSHVPEAVAGGLAAAGATAIGAAVIAKDKVSEAYQTATEPTASSKEVPEVVTESQNRAHADPEAAASPEVVREKAAFEDELKHAVPEAPATSESGLLGASEGGLTGKIAAGTAAAGAAAAGLAYAAKDKAADAYQSAGEPFSNVTKEPTIDGSVPETVTESQHRAHVAPEASASPEAVREKTAMEGELLSEVHKAPATSESGAFGNSERGVSDKAAAGLAAASAAASTQASKAYDSVGQPFSSTAQQSTSGDDVPEVVTESQDRAHVAPEASANPEAVHEKHAMENELLSEVNKAPATSESGVLGNSERGVSGKAAAGIAAGTAAVGAAAAGTAYAARDKTTEATGRDPVSVLPASVQSAINDMNKNVSPVEPSFTSTTSPAVNSSSVPGAVVASQHEAHVSPEASAEREAVAEKSDMEKELLNRVPRTDEAGAPAPTESAALSATAPVQPSHTESSALGATGASATRTALDSSEPTGVVAVSDVSPLEKPSTTGVNAVHDLPSRDAPVSSTAATTATEQTPSYNEQTAATAAKTGLNAPASSEAQTPATKASQLVAPEAPTEHSRDVSPMTRPDSSKQSEPQVTTGVEKSTAPTTSAPSTPQRSATKRSSGFFRGTPQSDRTSVAASEDKPKKKGFLAKLKEKFRS